MPSVDEPERPNQCIATHQFNKSKRASSFLIPESDDEVKIPISSKGALPSLMMRGYSCRGEQYRSSLPDKFPAQPESK
jgi:hypothetical protein